jgi:hypothetical protein
MFAKVCVEVIFIHPHAQDNQIEIKFLYRKFLSLDKKRKKERV